MGLLQKLLSTLGLRESSTGRGSERAGETTVTVEHEPDTATESAVKGTEGAAAGTTASGSTGTVDDSTEAETDPTESAGSTANVDETVEEDIEEAEPATDAADQADESEATEDETADTTATATGNDESPDVLNGIGPAYAERLENAGVDTVDELAAADAAELADETGLGEGRIANWIEQAKEF